MAITGWRNSSLLISLSKTCWKTRPTQTTQPPPTLSTDIDEPQRSHRREIYLRALKEVQQTERLRKKEALAKRIIRPVDEGEISENPSDQSKTAGQRCIWNERDITKLRAGFEEVERDRLRLKRQLSCSEEQLKAEHDERMKLQGLVEKLEEQLSLSKKRAAHQALMVNDLKSESQKMNAQLHKRTIQVRETEEEADRWKTSLRKAKEDMQQISLERSNLAWELERAQAHGNLKETDWKKRLRLKMRLCSWGFREEVEQTRADLCTERESHARSRTALELLRRHFSSQYIVAIIKMWLKMQPFIYFWIKTKLMLPHTFKCQLFILF